MEISSRAKELLIAIGAGEKSHSQLQREFGENVPIGAEIQLLAQTGIVEEVDGFYSLTDAGIKVAALPGTEIPDDIGKEMERQRKAEASIKIDKPGEAAAAYKKGMGYKDAEPTSAQAKYQAGLQRMLRGDTPGSIQPQGDFSEEGEPALEGADEGKEPVDINVISSENASCMIFGEVNPLFCTSMCRAYDVTGACKMTEKLAEALK